jgi:hypothetical protein
MVITGSSIARPNRAFAEIRPDLQKDLAGSRIGAAALDI